MLDYIGVPNGIFRHLGRVIGRLNSYNAIAATTLQADVAALITNFADTWLPTEGVATLYERLKDSVVGWRQSLSALGDSRLLDLYSVLRPLNLSQGTGLDEVLPELVRRFVYDSQNVRASACTVSGITAGSTNSGNGKAYTTLTLDGVSSPVLGAIPHVLYNGLDSQFCSPSETMTLQCVADAPTDGVLDGSEVWSWYGATNFPDLDYRAEGSGQAPGIITSDAFTALVGGDLETWSGGVPQGWDLLSGTILQDSGQRFRNYAACRLDAGSGELSQTISPYILTGKRRYCVSLAILAPSADVATAYFTASFVGTGYAATSAEKIVYATGSFPTAWTLVNFWINMPAPLPTDDSWRLSIRWGNTTHPLWIDTVSFAPVDYHGGVGLNIVSGSRPWLRGDRLTFTTSNNQAGKWQDYFRRHYLTQLPSITPTIPVPNQPMLPHPYSLMGPGVTGVGGVQGFLPLNYLLLQTGEGAMSYPTIPEELIV